MRDIEYRCWSHNSNTMQGWDELKEHGDFYRLLEMPDKYPLMQFTGLLDAKGNKVFVGDILKVPDENAYIPWVVVDDTFIFAVKHPNNSRVFPVDSKFFFERREVIGNIYEHPHLIKGDE